MNDRSDCTAHEALTDFAASAQDTVIGFCYSPAAAPWFRLHGPEPIGPGGLRVPLDGVFEVRAFDGARELRWRNESGGRGRPFVIDDNALPEGWRAGKTYQRVLWGAARESDAEWTELFAARIGSVHVPIGDVQRHATVRVDVQEYLVEDEEHGNVSVVDERLIGLTHLPAKETA